MDIYFFRSNNRIILITRPLNFCLYQQIVRNFKNQILFTIKYLNDLLLNPKLFQIRNKLHCALSTMDQQCRKRTSTSFRASTLQWDYQPFSGITNLRPPSRPLLSSPTHICLKIAYLRRGEGKEKEIVIFITLNLQKLRILGLKSTTELHWVRILQSSSNLSIQ